MRQKNGLSAETKEAIGIYVDMLCKNSKNTSDVLDTVTSYFRQFSEALFEGCRQLEIKAITPLKSPESLIDELTDGKTLAEIYGITPKQLSLGYEKAVKLMQNGHYEEAKSSFFFLVTLCPIVDDFWMGLAHSFFHLQDFAAAEYAARQVIAIAPQKCDGYLCIARMLCERHEYNQALDFLDASVLLFSDKKNEPWVQKLVNALTLAKEEVKKLR
jgi:tetratricopeptide (TPR) repeat protein